MSEFDMNSWIRGDARSGGEPGEKRVPGSSRRQGQGQREGQDQEQIPTLADIAKLSPEGLRDAIPQIEGQLEQLAETASQAQAAVAAAAEVRGAAVARLAALEGGGAASEGGSSSAGGQGQQARGR